MMFKRIGAVGLAAGVAAAAALALTGLAPVAQAAGQAQAAQQTSRTPPPATAFARRAAISSVSLSPDGRHVMGITSSDGKQRVLSIWQTEDLTKAPYVVATDPRSEIVGAQFVKNDRIFVTTQQLSDFNPFSGQVEKTYRSRTQVLDLQGRPVRVGVRFDGLNEQQQAFVGIGSLESSLPRDPESVLVSDNRGDVYRLNLYNGRSERIQRGSEKYGAGDWDITGEVRARQTFDFDGGAAYIATELKDPVTGEWAEHFRSYARDRTPIDVVAYSNDPNLIFVRKVEGDRDAIFEYSIKDKAFGEIAFAHPNFDAGGVIRSTAPQDFGEVVGFTYEAERGRTFWVNPTLDAAFKQIRATLRIQDVTASWTDISTGERSNITYGDGADISITSTSQDRTKFIAVKSGASTPPEVYIIQNGRIALLGRAYPELRNAPLGKASLIQYTARDGLVVPGILYKPDAAIYGEGPYPTVIVPHGGPWARDSMTWDPTGWTQYFASRGYAVLQPQFRGSEGWGQRLWRAGDREWGRKMQDDIDDGARWLIQQRIAAPDRIAVHGYSYGGYVGMMAAVRPNGLYQCSVAGAGPATIDLFKKATFGNRFLREFQHPTAEGEDPLRRISEVSIPIYLYTGDRDTRVIPQESRAFAAALRAAGKPHRIEILPDMEHTLNTWTPANTALILTSVEDFFKTDCGPGGL